MNIGKLFWVGYAIAALFILFSVYGIVGFLEYTSGPEIVLADTDTPAQANDPFPFDEASPKVAANPIIFTDDLSYGWQTAVWDSDVRASTDTVFSGTRSLHFRTQVPWAGVVFESRSKPAPFKSIQLSVNAVQNGDGLYLEAKGKDGRSIGRAPLSWYYPAHALVKGAWVSLSIPASQLGIQGDNFSSLSLVSAMPSEAYLDQIMLSTAQVDWPVYIAPVLTYDVPLVITNKGTLPYTPDATYSNWRRLYGMFTTTTPVKTGSELTELGSQGSLALYTDGGQFTNYKFESTINWGTGDVFTLVARFKDESNYISCAFADASTVAALYLVTKGESIRLGESPQLQRPQMDAFINRKNAIEVIGNTVGCYVDGERVLSMTLPQMESTGTIGVATWSKLPKTIPHTILNLSVEAK
ncbi:MAG: hypothetical protein RLZZ283_222 [Candidatus Parcubacteria bacterium]|jgi:hypothetical protein